MSMATTPETRFPSLWGRHPSDPLRPGVEAPFSPGGLTTVPPIACSPVSAQGPGASEPPVPWPSGRPAHLPGPAFRNRLSGTPAPSLGLARSEVCGPTITQGDNLSSWLWRFSRCGRPSHPPPSRSCPSPVHLWREMHSEGPVS